VKILIIEDDTKIVTALTYSCQIVWPSLEIVESRWGEKGIDIVERQNPDIVILDLGLPDINGMEVLKRIRMFSRVPILVLTVDQEESTVVQALELGANDYVLKPFRQMELVARLKRLFLERSEIDDSVPIFFGSLVYDYARRSVILRNKSVTLRSLENEILNKLIKESPYTVTHSALAKAVWGDDYDGCTNTLKVHIRHLRQNLEENPGDPKIILTKIGIGYYAIKPQ